MYPKWPLPDFEKVWLNLFDNRSSFKYGKKLSSESSTKDCKRENSSIFLPKDYNYEVESSLEWKKPTI